MKPNDQETAVVPEWLVERLAAGDLPPARAAEVRRRLALEPDGAARLARVAASNAEILAAHPPADLAAEVRRRADGGARATAARSRRHWGFAVMAPTLGLAALGLTLWLRPVTPGHPRAGSVATGAGDDGDNIKGLQPRLRVYRKAGDKVERLRDGAVVRAGDRLQLAYVAAGYRFGAVLSVDGAGKVTFHLPSAGPAVERLRPDGEVALPEAYELDAAPAFERFVLVAGNAPFDPGTLGDVARGAASAPAGTVTITFTVRKEQLR